VLLRYLNSVYKVLANTVPDATKTEAIRDMEVFFGEMLRRVDSSLLEEWQRLQNPDYIPVLENELRPPGAEAAEAATKNDITLDPVTFLALIRVRIFSFMASLSRSEYAAALECLTEGLDDFLANSSGFGNDWALLDIDDIAWTEERLREKMGEYRPSHGIFRLDPEGRAMRHTVVEPQTRTDSGSISVWEVKQMLQDNEGHNDWNLEFCVDLQESKLAGVPVMRLSRMGEMQP
jgi:Domain of unknown function (DUF3516)